MKKKLMKSAARVLGAAAAVILIVWFAVAQPSCRRNRVSGAAADPGVLREHVETLSIRLSPRDWKHTDNLDKCADFIAQHFRKAGATVEFQSFAVRGRQYKNVIGRFNAENGSRVIVGAHYDACAGTPGADDNASGVAALIELAYLLGHNRSSGAVDLVAYVLEEPPFFGTEHMGSAVHARSIADDKSSVKGVIVLEMVGCFRDEWGSQSYPTLFFRFMYPNRANFLGVASRWDQGEWIQQVKTRMKGTTDLPVYSIRAPAFLPGIDFSDHMNYWNYGIRALMITDTAFYRNRAYHTPDDTPDKLDYSRMAKVVVSVFEAVKNL